MEVYITVLKQVCSVYSMYIYACMYVCTMIMEIKLIGTFRMKLNKSFCLVEEQEYQKYKRSF